MCVQSQSAVAASEYIRAMVCGMPQPLRSQRLIAMLKGFFDDSGSDGERIPFVIGGYVLSIDQWAQFADDWKAELDREPKVEFFHMTDAAQGYGPFIGMPWEFRKCKVRDMLGVIKKHNPDGLYTWTSWENYRAIVGPEVVGYMKNPYMLLYSVIQETILDYQKRKGIFPERIELCFDQQGELGNFARMFYLPTKDAMPPEIQQMLGGEPDIKDDKLVVPLQAADLLAWSVRRRNDPEFAADDEWEWLHQELHSTTALGSQCDERTLRGIAEIAKVASARAEAMYRKLTGRV